MIHWNGYLVVYDPRMQRMAAFRWLFARWVFSHHYKGNEP